MTLLCLYVQNSPQVMADQHNGFVDNRDIKVMNKRADCGWIMDAELRRARLPDVVYLTTDGKTRMANASQKTIL